MTAPHIPPTVLEACLAYAHAHLFREGDARLFWAVHTALQETLVLEHTPWRARLLVHLVGARDLVARELVREGKVKEGEMNDGSSKQRRTP